VLPCQRRQVLGSLHGLGSRTPPPDTVRTNCRAWSNFLNAIRAPPNRDGCARDWTRYGRSGNALRKAYAVSPFMSGQHTPAGRAMPLRAWFAQGADRVHPTRSGSEQLSTSNRPGTPEMPIGSAIARRGSTVRRIPGYSQARPYAWSQSDWSVFLNAISPMLTGCSPPELEPTSSAAGLARLSEVVSRPHISSTVRIWSDFLNAIRFSSKPG
jgi:hypothetical protein